jgi:hypothetical protein
VNIIHQIYGPIPSSGTGIATERLQKAAQVTKNQLIWPNKTLQMQSVSQRAI